MILPLYQQPMQVFRRFPGKVFFAPIRGACQDGGTRPSDFAPFDELRATTDKLNGLVYA